MPVRLDAAAASPSDAHLSERAAAFRDGFMQQPPRKATLSLTAGLIAAVRLYEEGRRVN
jgi:hypothetical protein